MRAGMEAATGTDAARRLEGDKAQRIIAAMRASVGSRGAAASTFDHVAREAGGSRGLLPYHFGTKEQLLAGGWPPPPWGTRERVLGEVCRHDCEVRIRAMEERLAGADSPDAIIGALRHELEEFPGGEPASQAVIYELLSASRHSEELRAELAELYRRWREHLAAALREKEAEGVVRLEADPDVVASVL